MLCTIIKKELLEKILTLRFFVAFLLSFGLTTISTLVLSNNYVQELTDYHSRVKLHTETSSKDGTYVNRKPLVLAALFRGISTHSAVSVRLVNDAHPEPIEAIDDNPFSAMFPTVDLTFIVGIMMSLLAILFTYDVVCGERERGTLALIVSNPLPRWMLIFGKWLGVYLSLILPCLIGLLAGLLIISTHPQIQLTASDWGALGWIIICILLYLACFFALGVLISALTSRSSTSLLTLLFLWTLAVFVVPNVSPDISKVISPIPSSVTHVREMKLQEKELHRQRRRAHNELALELIEKRFSHAPGFVEFVEIEKFFNDTQRKMFSRITANYRRAVQRQERVAAGIATLSPYACFVFLATQLAATDPESEARFIVSAERFHFDEYYPDGTSWVSKPEWDEKPVFSYTELGTSNLLKTGMAPLALLLLFTTLFLMGGYAVFLQYDVKR